MALRQAPHSAEIATNLRDVSAARCDARGQQLADAGRWQRGRRLPSARRSQLQPDYVPALGNLGNALKNLGQMDDAAACYRRILEIAPERRAGCITTWA